MQNYTPNSNSKRMETTAERGGGGSASSRWNPTKEQINILENLYKQGVRTPSAEEIQQITSRLKGYGHIEGKNVFYWFQNHKARQRQKQKQDTATLAYFNHFIAFNNNPSPLPPFPNPPNVICSPYYVHQNDVGFYPQYHNNSNMIQSNAIMRRKSNTDQRRSCNKNNGFGYESCEIAHTETLSLFPTHPTGDLQVGPPPPPPQAAASASSVNSSDNSSGRSCGTYFDFFQ